MTQLLKDLKFPTKFLSSDDVKQIIYKNTGYTGDTKCIIKKESVNSLSDISCDKNMSCKNIYSKSYETHDAYDTYFEEQINLNKELKRLEIGSCMVWDNYNIDSSSVKYTLDII